MNRQAPSKTLAAGRIVLMAVALVAAAAGVVATKASPSRGAEPNPAPTEVVVTGDDRDTRPGCGPRRMGSLLMRWNRALNAANTQTLRRFWREEEKGLRNDRRAHARGTFKWFSLTDSPSRTHADHFVAYQPRRALHYVRKRRGFRLQLTDAIGNGGFQGLWILDDGSARQVIGKGKILCKERKRPLIQVWSMRVVAPGEEVPWGECPDPPGGAPPGTLIACATGTEVVP